MLFECAETDSEWIQYLASRESTGASHRIAKELHGLRRRYEFLANTLVLLVICPHYHMGLQDPLSRYADGPVENVLLFICDSLRYDSLPPDIADLGLTGRAISASIFTGSGLPSLLTGTYATTHGVWGFDQQLPATPPLLSVPEHSGLDIGDIWGWPLRVAGLESPDWEELLERRLLPDLPEPFVYVFHDKGGHAPYGSPLEEWESMRDYFESVTDPATLRSQYVEGVEQSMERFRDLLDTLDDRGILSRTLVVLTSDHGELLGERGGLFGHTKPMTPELLEVPVLLTGAGIQRNGRLEYLLSTTDVAPTALGALGETIPAGLDGTDVWSRSPTSGRQTRAHVWQGGPENRLRAEYMAASVWDEAGGHVFHLNSMGRRFASTLAQYRGGFGPANRSLSPRNWWVLARSHLPSRVTYGTPGFSPEDIGSSIPDRFERVQTHIPADVEPDESQLRQLGYL